MCPLFSPAGVNHRGDVRRGGGQMDPNSKKCPYCKLINPASAQVCDCGYKFTGNVPDPSQLKALYEKQARIMIPAGFSR